MIYTKNQQEALDYRGGNLLIIACAGSGKTQVLSRRIALLVSEGVPKESIIAFTFTDMAAGELKSRIRKELASLREEGRIDDASLGEIYIGTIHSFSLQLLKEIHLHILRNLLQIFNMIMSALIHRLCFPGRIVLIPLFR